MPRITEDERKRFHALLDQSIDKMNRPKNANKSHWWQLNTEYLFKMLAIEVAELDCAIVFSKQDGIAEECMDVINFAMMIFDNERGN